MGKWSYRWTVEYYRAGQWFERKSVEAKSRSEAIGKVRKMVSDIIEIHCCVRSQTW